MPLRKGPAATGGGKVPEDVRARTRKGAGGGGGARRAGGAVSAGAPFPGTQPVGSAGANAAPAQVTVSGPLIQRPSSATDFNIFGTLVARTAANTPAAFPGAFTIPSQNMGVIRSIAILANALLVTSSIIWTLRFNQVPVPGWQSLTINPRAAGSVELNFGPEETQIPVPEGSQVDVQVEVLDAGTYQVSAAVHGWYFPKRLFEQFQQAGA